MAVQSSGEGMSSLYCLLDNLILYRLRVLSCQHVWFRAAHIDTGSTWSGTQRTFQKTRLPLRNLSSLPIAYNHLPPYTYFGLHYSTHQQTCSPITWHHCCSAGLGASVAHFHTSPWQQDPTKKAVVEKAVDGLKEKSKSVVTEQEAKVRGISCEV